MILIAHRSLGGTGARGGLIPTMETPTGATSAVAKLAHQRRDPTAEWTFEEALRERGECNRDDEEQRQRNEVGQHSHILRRIQALIRRWIKVDRLLV
jgi:hypothetical protein